ncbi:MAG: hypothetical protein EPO03_11810, partial [Porticoccaceae bacterium]
EITGQAPPPPPPPPVNVLSDDNEVVSTPEDTSVTGNVLANTVNPDGPFAASVTQFSVAGDPTVYAPGFTVTIADVGTLVVNADGSFAFNPAADFNGPVPVVTYTLTDGAATDVSTLSITVDPVNDAPVANPDTNWAKEDTVNASGNVLLNATHAGAPSGTFADVADTDVDLDPLTVTGHTGGDAYGTLTLNADGSYTYVLDNSLPAVQALQEGGTLTETYTYTVSDGTTANTATLTITIFGTDDTATVVTAVAEAPDATVYEHGLTSVPDTSETTTGSFTLSATDGILNVVIGGTTFTLAQMQAFGTTPGVVNTGEGVLTLTGYTGTATGGTVSYSYTLSATIDNDSKVPTGSDTVDGTGFNDSIHITVNGVGGTTAGDDLVIRAIDDVPTAYADTDSILAGGFGPADGNVVTGSGGSDANATDGVADTLGADGFGSISWLGAVGSTVTGTYGVLTVGADGSYSYARNAGTPGGVSDVFHYTLTDGDGDTSSTTLTINIGDATPTLHLPTGTDAGTSVNEAGLPAGSGEMADGNPSNNSDTSETTAGAITFTPGDTPAVVTIGGVTVTGTVGQTFSGSYGTLTIAAGTNLATGTINYSYTLTTNTSGNTTHDSFAVVVTDANSDTASGALNIAIVDDVPHATDHDGFIKDSSFSQVLSGLVDYGLGADGFGGVTLSLTSATSGGSPISLTSHGHAVTTAAIDSNGDGLQELVGFVNNTGGTSGYDAGIDTLVFNLAPHTASAAYGTYDLTLYDVLDLQAPTQTFTVGSIVAGAPTSGIVINNGAGGGISVLATPESGHTVNSNTGELGIDNTILNANVGYDEKITLQFGTAFSGTTVTTAAVLNDVRITGVDVGSGADKFSWVAFKGTTVVGSSVSDLTMTTVSGQNEIAPAIHVDGGYDKLVLTMTAGDFKMSGFTYSQQGASIDTLLNFNYTAADAGGDTATGSFQVTVSDTHVTGLVPGAGDLATIHDILTG